jgi:hypothetical protein
MNQSVGGGERKATGHHGDQERDEAAEDGRTGGASKRERLDLGQGHRSQPIDQSPLGKELHVEVRR